MADQKQASEQLAAQIVSQFQPKIPDTLAKEQTAIKKLAADLVIEDEESYIFAGELRNKIRRTTDLMKAVVNPFPQLIHLAHRLATAYRDGQLKPFEEADGVLAQKRIAYSNKKEQERREEQKRREAAAHAQQVRDAEKEAKQIKKVDPEAAAAIVEAAKTAPPPTVVVPRAELPKQGAVEKINYTFTLLDAQKVNRAFLCPDEKLIGKTVRNMGARAIDVVGPGSIEVHEEQSEYMRKTK